MGKVLIKNIMTPLEKLEEIREMHIKLRFLYDHNGETEWDDIEEIFNELIEDNDICNL